LDYSLDEHTHTHIHCSDLTIFSTSQQSQCDRWECCNSWQVYFLSMCTCWSKRRWVCYRWGDINRKQQMLSSYFQPLAEKVKLIEWMWRTWLEKHSWRGDHEEWHKGKKRQRRTDKSTAI